ncbi:MAG: LysR substrate-binding domain-containing protein [Aliidongia sp.]
MSSPLRISAASSRLPEHCHVAQPSLSVQVSKLESRLGTVIFERTTRRLILTSDGHLLIEQMRRVLAEGRALVTLARRSNEPFGGTLRLSAIATLGPYYFPQVLPTLRAQYPNLSLVLGEGRTDALVAALLQGQLDAVLMSTPGARSGLERDAAVPGAVHHGLPVGASGARIVGHGLDRARSDGTAAAGRRPLPARPGDRCLRRHQCLQSARHRPRNPEIHGRRRRRVHP